MNNAANKTPDTHARAAVEALRCRQVDEFERIMEMHHVDPDICGANGKPLIYLATELRSVQGVGWLIDHGANVNAINPENNCNAIFPASKNPSPAITVLLLAAGARADLIGKNNENPLHASVLHSYQTKNGTVEHLLNAGADAHGDAAVMEAVQTMAQRCDNSSAVELLQTHGKRPKLPEGPLVGLTKDSLLQEHAEGLALLDTPSTWHRWKEVCAALDTPFSKAELLAERPEGGSWLMRAVSCFSASAVISRLNAQGESIASADLVDAEGKQTALCKTLTDFGALKKVLNATNWQESGQALQRVYQALDSRGKHQVSNYHGLMAEVSSRSAEQKGMGRG